MRKILGKHLRASVFSGNDRACDGDPRHKRHRRFLKCDVRRCTLDCNAFNSSFIPWSGPDIRGKCRLHLQRGMKRLAGLDGCSLATGLARPEPRMRDFTFRIPYFTFRVPRLSRVQVSADYFSGSCESDFVLVVTSRTGSARFLPEQNRLCAVKFLITVLES